MISVPEIALEAVAGVRGSGDSLFELSLAAVRKLGGANGFGGVVAATFSNPDRFPCLAVRLAQAIGLPSAVPAFDLQLACSAYPYALYVAGRLAADLRRPVLVVDGDVQSRLVDPRDPATGAIFSDAATATVVTSDPDSGLRSPFAFLSDCDEALACPEAGPIRMDGLRVFDFVATSVRKFLEPFAAERPDFFVPHQANPYMIRQLAKSLGLTDRLVALDEKVRNPGSCSVPLTLAQGGVRGRILVAGFGAGFSAAAGIVRVK